MTIIRHNVISGSVDQAHLPRIGAENFFRDGLVSVSSAAVGHPKNLAYDGMTYDAWMSTGDATEWIRVQLPIAKSADYMSVYGHTLAGCTVKPQKSPDGTTWTDLNTGYAVPDNKPIIWEFTETSDFFWRLLIEDAEAPVSISAIHVGKKLRLPRGLPRNWKPPELNQRKKYTNVMSEGGQILGRHVIRTGVEIDVDTKDIEYAWSRDDWRSFIDIADRFPVFFWWVYGSRAEIAYAAVESSDGQFSTDIHVSTGFKLVGVN